MGPDQREDIPRSSTKTCGPDQREDIPRSANKTWGPDQREDIPRSATKTCGPDQREDIPRSANKPWGPDQREDIPRSATKTWGLTCGNRRQCPPDRPVDPPPHSGTDSSTCPVHTSSHSNKKESSRNLNGLEVAKFVLSWNKFV
jgi:hypothetical protein